MAIKAAILRNAVAGGMGRVSMLLYRLVQVPLLLTAFGVDEYGRWLLISSMLAWLSLANLGFGTVAANDISMAVAAGNLDRARRVYSTSLALLGGLVAAGGLFLAATVTLMPWARWLQVAAARQAELAGAIFWLAATVLVSFAGDVSGGRLRAARKAHWAMSMSAARPWLEVFAMLISLHFSRRFDVLAFSLFASSLCFFGVLHWLSHLALPDLSFRRGLVDTTLFRRLIGKGITFQAFPLGNALLFQGNLLVIQAVLGPAAVALFGTARTMVRAISQAMELVNQVMWQEMSLLLGAGDLKRAARLHRIGVTVSFAIACGGVVVLAAIGAPLYEWWTGKAIELSQNLLMIFLLSIPFNALWLTSAVVHYASNQHEGLAWRYVMATGIGVLASLIFAKLYGIEGAAISTLVVDLLLIRYVLARSLRLTGDSWRGFGAGIVQESLQAIRPAGVRR